MVNFLSLLPADHAVRTEPKAAVIQRLGQLPMVGIPTSVVMAREWFAACTWLGAPGNIDDPVALTGLNPPERRSICSMLNISESGAIGAVVGRILKIVKERSGGTPFADLLYSVDPAVLQQLNNLSAADLTIRLAGTPLESVAEGLAGVELRDIAALAWWLFNKCNSGADVSALGEVARNRIWDIFLIQAAWDERVKHATLESMLKVWHEQHLPPDSPPSPPRPLPPDDEEAVDLTSPMTELGLASPTVARAAILAWSQGRSATPANWWGGRAPVLAPGQPALPPEATNLGRAQLGVSGIDGESAFAPLLAGGYDATYAIALKVADKTQYMGPRDRVAAIVVGILQRHLTLYCNPMQRMTQDQHDVLRQKRKAGHKMATAPFAAFPHTQPVGLAPGEILDMVVLGSQLRLSLMADSSQAVDHTTLLRRSQRQQTIDKILTAFDTSMAKGDLAGFLQALESFKKFVQVEADSNRAEALADHNTYPSCIQLKEVAAGRDVIAASIPALFAEIDRRLGDSCDPSASTSQIQLLTGSWGLFMEGFKATSVMPASLHARTLVMGQAFAQGASGSSSGGSGGGGGGGGGGGSSSFGGGGSGGGGSSSGKGSGGGGDGGSGSTSDSHGSSPGSSSSSGLFPGLKPFGRGKCETGHHFPCSSEIVGNVVGIDILNIVCNKCQSSSHGKGECPTDWGEWGRQLPGFSKSGKRLGSKWNGSEPKRATFVEWVAFLEDKDNFPKGARAARYPGSPGISEFRDRAKKAPP